MMGGPSLEVWWLWVVGGIVLSLLELLGSGLFLLSIGLGCILAGLASLWLGFKGQLVIFILSSVAIFFSARVLIHRPKAEGEQSFGTDALLGREGVAECAITEDSGYVKIGGESWPARLDSGGPIEEGCKVVVIRLDGNKALVARSGESKP